MGSLGHAVGFEHRCSEGRLEVVHDLRRQGGAARTNEPQFFGAGRPRRHPVAHARAATDGSSERPNTRWPRVSRAMRQNDSGENFDGTTTAPPRGQRAQRGGHQPVDVKERHHAERHVLGAERVAARNVLCRDGEVGMAERHALRASGAAAGVQDERHIVQGRRGDRCASRHIAERHHAARARLHRQDRHGSSGRAGLVHTVRRQQQHLGAGVLEEKSELVFLVAGVERGCRARHRRGQERHHRRQTVGEGHADAVAAADAECRQCLGQVLHLAAQLAIGDADVLLGQDDRGPIGWNRVEQAGEGGRY